MATYVSSGKGAAGRVLQREEGNLHEWNLHEGNLHEGNLHEGNLHEGNLHVAAGGRRLWCVRSQVQPQSPQKYTIS